MGRTACCVVLVCALVLAGCSGFAAEGDPSENAAASVTPAPVPTTAEAPARAPGLSANGVTDASALGAAHDAALRNTSFTERVAWTFRYSNGSFYQGRWWVTQVGESGSKYHDVRHRSGAWLSEFRSRGYVTTGVERWSGGERAWRADVLFDGTQRYSKLSTREADDVRRSVTDPGGERIAGLLRGTETRVTGRVVRDGTPLYRVGALGLSKNRLPTDPDLAFPADVSLSLVVGREGRIRSYTVTYTTRTPAGTALTAAYVVQYGQIGETTIERPTWYDAAIVATNETPETTGSATGGTTATEPPANETDETDETDANADATTMGMERVRGRW